MKILVLFIAIMLYSISSHAQNPEHVAGNDSSFENLIELEPRPNKEKNNDRHRIPARQNDVECYYLDGNLHINFEFPEGDATLNIYDMSGTKCLQQPFSTTTTFIYNIGVVTEHVKIEIETSTNIYEGWLIF
jgi:hypothetical protein